MDRTATKRITAALAVLALGGCPFLGSCADPGEPDGLETRLRELERRLVAEERERIRTLEPEQLADDAAARHGSDPYRIAALPGGDRFLVLLRNNSEIVLADGRGAIVDRHATPRSPAGWDGVETPRGRTVLVAGELSSRLALYDVGADRIELRREWDLGEVGSIRDLALLESRDRVFLIDAFRRRLLRFELPGGWQSGAPESPILPEIATDWQAPTGAGPVEIRVVSGHLVVNELLEHSLRFFPLDDDGQPDLEEDLGITHAGPIWAFDVLPRDDHLLVAVGGVENRPLDRTSGEFGYVDSFLWLYRLPRDPESGRILPGAGGEAPAPTASDDLSARGVVTPKSLRFVATDDGATRLWATGYGGETAIQYGIDGERLQPVERLEVPPGSIDLVAENGTLRIANPLLDGIVTVRPDGRRHFDRLGSRDGGTDPTGERGPSRGVARGPSAGAGGDDGTAARRLGEVLFFTTLMSPANRTEGELSRFTCETCHFEGTVDGRTHFTGRGHVFATTKPLRGLADNVPLFSRAGDPDLASMIMAEFRVANQDREATFDLEVEEHPWLGRLGELPTTVDPWLQRRALLEFLIGFRHRPQPLRAQGRRLDDAARRGLQVFRDRCEHCHQAVTSTRPEGRAVDPAEWPAWLETEGRDLVWGAPFFSKTGIEPYVDEAGARVPSLRRIVLKHPYFTDGSSDDLKDVLERYRYRELSGWHDPPERPDVQALSDAEIEALLQLLQFF